MWAAWLPTGVAFRGAHRRRRDLLQKNRATSTKSAPELLSLASWRCSQFRLTLGIEWLSAQLPVGLLQQNFDLTFRFLELFLTFTRKFNAFLKKLHRVVQRKLRRFQPANYFFQPPERFLKIGLLRRLGLFYRCCIQSRLKTLLRHAK